MTIIYHLAARTGPLPRPLPLALLCHPRRLDRMCDNAAKACAAHGTARLSIFAGCVRWPTCQTIIYLMLSTGYLLNKKFASALIQLTLWQDVQDWSGRIHIREDNKWAREPSPFSPHWHVSIREARNREIISARHELKCIMTNILQSLLRTDAWDKVSLFRFILPLVLGVKGYIRFAGGLIIDKDLHVSIWAEIPTRLADKESLLCLGR